MRVAEFGTGPCDDEVFDLRGRGAVFLGVQQWHSWVETQLQPSRMKVRLLVRRICKWYETNLRVQSLMTCLDLRDRDFLGGLAGRQPAPEAYSFLRRQCG